MNNGVIRASPGGSLLSLLLKYPICLLLFHFLCVLPMVADCPTAALLQSERQPWAGTGNSALPVQNGSGRFSRPVLIIGFPPACLPAPPRPSQRFLQVEKCCHVEDPGAVGNLPHLPSVLRKLLNENQNTSCHLLRSSHRVTYKTTWGHARATRRAWKFQHVLGIRHWTAGDWKALQWNGSSFPTRMTGNCRKKSLEPLGHPQGGILQGPGTVRKGLASRTVRLCSALSLRWHIENFGLMSCLLFVPR